MKKSKMKGLPKMKHMGMPIEKHKKEMHKKKGMK